MRLDHRGYQHIGVDDDPDHLARGFVFLMARFSRRYADTSLSISRGVSLSSPFLLASVRSAATAAASSWRALEDDMTSSCRYRRKASRISSLNVRFCFFARRAASLAMAGGIVIATTFVVRMRLTQYYLVLQKIAPRIAAGAFGACAVALRCPPLCDISRLLTC